MIDEIGGMEEVKTVKSAAQRGVILVATAHGVSLTNLICNPDLNGLVGGLCQVTIGDAAAKGCVTITTRQHCLVAKCACWLQLSQVASGFVGFVCQGDTSTNPCCCRLFIVLPTSGALPLLVMKCTLQYQTLLTQFPKPIGNIRLIDPNSNCLVMHC